MFQSIMMAVCAASFGALSSAGVFTILATVGLIPRFAGRTHTSRHVILYEEMVIMGTLLGGCFSLWSRYLKVGDWLYTLGWSRELITICGEVYIGIFGLFAGIFIGCLALSIAEILDSIPIFFRRVRLGRGLKYVILGMAVGKICGSIIYFFVAIQSQANS